MPWGPEGNTMRTYVVVALLSVIWLIIIAMGHRRYVALALAGIIVLICVARAWLDVRRGPPWVRG
jgi:tryptophan-rich sensory protein